MSKSISKEQFEKEFKNLVANEDFNGSISLVNSVESSVLETEFGYNEYNALHYASRYGTVELVQAIHSQNSNLIGTLTTNGSSALHLSRDLSISKFLLEQHSDLIGIKNSEGYTALHFAAMKGNPELITLYSSKMTEDQINAVTQTDALTALHLAAQRGFSESVTLLVEYSRELLTCPDSKGYIPLHYAAALNNNTDTLSFLLQKKFNPEEQIKSQAGGYYNYPPLHLAAENNRIDTIKLIVKIYPNALKILGSDGRNPLHAAAASRQDCTDAAKILCELMDKENIKEYIIEMDASKKTPLILAFEKNRDLLVDFLQENYNFPVSSLQLYESMSKLSSSKFEDIQYSITELKNPVTALYAISNRLFNDDKKEEGIACYKAAKQLEESQRISKQLMGPKFSDCSGQYPPFWVKESLVGVLNKNYIIEFVNDEFFSSSCLGSRVECFLEQVQNDKKIVLLLTNKEMTFCNRAIKLEKTDDGCKFIYINPLGEPYSNDFTAKNVFSLVTNKADGSVTIVDLRSAHASEDVNIGLYIIEDLKRLDSLDASVNKATLVKSLPGKEFNSEQAEETLELVIDTSPFYSTQKMNMLANIIFKDCDTEVFSPVFLVKQQVIENFNSAIQYVINCNKPSVLIAYDVGQKNWSGLAIKKKPETNNITLFLSDPGSQLLKFIGGISKIMIKCTQSYNIIKDTKDLNNNFDSGPTTLENLNNFIRYDLNLLNSSSSQAAKLFIDDFNMAREKHIVLLHKEGISVPVFEKVNFLTDTATSYRFSFISDQDMPDINAVNIIGSDEGLGIGNITGQ